MVKYLRRSLFSFMTIWRFWKMRELSSHYIPTRDLGFLGFHGRNGKWAVSRQRIDPLRRRLDGVEVAMDFLSFRYFYGYLELF